MSFISWFLQQEGEKEREARKRKTGWKRKREGGTESIFVTCFWCELNSFIGEIKTFWQSETLWIRSNTRFTDRLPSLTVEHFLTTHTSFRLDYVTLLFISLSKTILKPNSHSPTSNIMSSSSSCRATSTGIPGPLSTLFPIVHRLWLVFRATFLILT